MGDVNMAVAKAVVSTTKTYDTALKKVSKFANPYPYIRIQVHNVPGFRLRKLQRSKLPKELRLPR